MISNELLTAIFKQECFFSQVIGNDVEYYYKSNSPHFNKFIYRQINIYELIHKCKVFAESKGFGSTVTYFNNVCSTVVLFDIKWSPPKKEEFIFEDEDENIAMIKACQWITDTEEIF